MIFHGSLDFAQNDGLNKKRRTTNCTSGPAKADGPTRLPRNYTEVLRGSLVPALHRWKSETQWLVGPLQRLINIFYHIRGTKIRPAHGRLVAKDVVDLIPQSYPVIVPLLYGVPS